MNSPAVPLRQDAQVIGLVCTAHSISHFFQLILAALFPWLKDAFNVSYSELGLLMTAFFIVSGIGQALAGFVVDRVGADKVLFTGVGLLGIAALLLSQADSYAMLMAGSILAGLGNSVFHPADLTLLNQRVSAPRLAHAFSSHGISGNLGWAAAPLFLTTIATLYGWRTALAAASLLPFTILVLLLLNRGLLETRVADSGAGKEGSAARGAGLAFLRHPAVWMCVAFFFITAMAGTGIQGFAIPSLRDLYGIPLVLATAGFTAYMLASAGGMVCGGFLAARTTRHERTIAMSFTAAGVVAMLIASAILPGVMAVVLMAVLGFCSGLAGPSRDLLIRAAAPKNATGRVFGIVYSGLDAGMATAPLLFGLLMDRGHPSWVFIGIGILWLTALLTAVRVGSNNARKAMEAQAA
ncbi:MAG: MFS transporter [Noviherbaspirillum sp.]